MLSEPKTLSVVFSTKDRLQHLKELIDSIKTHTKDYEIIVVDDASTDGTREWLKEQKVSSILNDISRPVAEAWNQGVGISEGKYIVILNDDMLVSPGWADEQIKFYETHPNVGSLAFKIFDDNGMIQSRGHNFYKDILYLPDEENRVIDYSPTPFFLRSRFERVGGFTAHGQMYYEDTDFGLKLQSAGFINYYNPRTVLFHKTVGLRIGTDEDKLRRQQNENILQKQSREAFMAVWRPYLLSRQYR